MSGQAQSVLSELQYNLKINYGSMRADLLAEYAGGIPTPSVRRAIGELRAAGHNITHSAAGYKLNV